jgi:hypothetical protein
MSGRVEAFVGNPWNMSTAPSIPRVAICEPSLTTMAPELVTGAACGVRIGVAERFGRRIAFKPPSSPYQSIDRIALP